MKNQKLTTLPTEVSEAFVECGKATQVTHAMIGAFALLSGDLGPLHTNKFLAKMSQFGGIIAHGLLTLILLPRMVPAIALDQSRYTIINRGGSYLLKKPVRPGEWLRARIRLSEVRNKRGVSIRDYAFVVYGGKRRETKMTGTLTLVYSP